MSDHKFAALQEHILARSMSKYWNEAVSEWIQSISIYSQIPVQCPCGVIIKEQCYIYNTTTGAETFVGSKCIENFVPNFDHSLFDGLVRIQEDKRANTNAALCHYAYEQDVLSTKEFSFLLETCLSRKLSEKQLQWKERLNTKIISNMVKS